MGCESSHAGMPMRFRIQRTDKTRESGDCTRVRDFRSYVSQRGRQAMQHLVRCTEELAEEFRDPVILLSNLLRDESQGFESVKKLSRGSITQRTLSQCRDFSWGGGWAVTSQLQSFPCFLLQPSICFLQLKLKSDHEIAQIQEAPRRENDKRWKVNSRGAGMTASASPRITTLQETTVNQLLWDWIFLSVKLENPSPSLCLRYQELLLF